MLIVPPPAVPSSVRFRTVVRSSVIPELNMTAARGADVMVIPGADLLEPVKPW
jgi:hypothetical protein